MFLMIKKMFWNPGLKTHVFKKHLNSFSCIISSMKLLGLSCFCIIFCNFFKKFKFLEFRSIECVFQPIKNPLIFNHYFLPNSIGIRLMLDQSKLKIFQFLNFWPIFFFFYASFVFRIHMHCIVFSLSILHFCSHIFHYFHT